MDSLECAELLPDAIYAVVAANIPLLAAGGSIHAATASLCGSLRGALE